MNTPSTADPSALPLPPSRAPVLAPATGHPLQLLWVWCLPQLVLLLLNLRALGGIWGEMSEAERTTGRWLLGAEIALLATVGLLALVLHRLRKPVAWGLNVPLLAVAVGYLWFALLATGSMIPNSVSLWILPRENFLYYQFALVMPAAFFALLRLACFASRRTVGWDVGVSFAVLAGVPLGLMFFLQTLGQFRWLRQFPAPVLSGLFVVVTVLAIGALLRLMVLAYVGASRRGPVGRAILTGLVALAAPLGGLLLNRTIPFPADFQSAGVYVLAVVNGFFLLLPHFRSPQLRRAVWLAQGLLFPFTLYFFVVFLPFLPLSLLAMIVAGAGFLVLTPIALFVLHGQHLIEGLRHEIQSSGRLIPVLLGGLAVSVLPLGYTAQALLDRQVLGRALDHVYNADYRASGFRGSPAAIERTLAALRDFKAGLQLPFISDYYNWLVFDGLVLPDEKMAQLQRIFVGTELPAPTRRMGQGSFFSETPSRNRGLLTESRGTAAPPPQTVNVARLTPVTEAEDAATERTRVTLELKNTDRAGSEFVTTLHVPSGVLVAGFWLHIGAERVPGRIFEKKSAQWVYQKIRDVTRRDPGILVYKNAETLELRVFPFAEQETRTVELEFLRPAAQAAEVRIGSAVLPLGVAAAPAQLALVSAPGNGAALVVAPGALAGLPTLVRRPYLHFIVDRGVNSKLAGEALRETLVRLARQFPEAQECMITAANFDAREVTDGLLKIDALPGWDVRELSRLPQRGGFAQDRALKRVLLRAADDLQTATPAALGRFPLPVVLRSAADMPITEGELEGFGRLAPDLGGYFVSVDGAAAVAQSWNGPDRSAMAPGPRPRPVVLFRLGPAVRVLAAEGTTSALLALPRGEGELQVWDAAAGTWRPAAHLALPGGNRYAQGVGAWLQQEALVEQPALGREALRRLVAASRSTGVIVPATSYIVVENSAQWRKLEETEKKKLASNGALELEETPEPTTAWLCVCGAAALLLGHRRRGKRPMPRAASAGFPDAVG